MARLWRNDFATPEGKYPIVLRRDGKPVETPYLVMLMKDPCFDAAMAAYADEAERRGFDPEYVADIRDLVARAPELRAQTTPGDPDAPPHRTEDPVLLAWARSLGCPGS